MRYKGDPSEILPREEQYMRGGTRRPLVTITISTYNSEATIDDVLNSLLQQDYPLKLIEVIVIDGHSIDGTVNKVKRFMEEHGNKFYDFKLIVHDRNYGVSKARNDGIKLARGEYIMILDSDVILPPNAISKMISFLNHNPKVGCCSALLEEDATDFVSRWRFELNIGKIRKIVACTAAAMIRREVIEKAGLYDESMGPPFSVDEDTEFAARIWRAGYKCIQLGNITARHLKIKADLHLAKVTGNIRDSKGITLFTYLRWLALYFKEPNPLTWYKFLRSLPLLTRARFILSSLFIPLILLITILLPLVLMSQSNLLYSIIFYVSISFAIIIFLDLFRDFVSSPRYLHKSIILALLACINRSARSIATIFYKIKILFKIQI